MSQIIEVDTGSVAVAKAPDKLRCSALGSCVAVILYDAQNKIGGIAHVMLPSTNTYIRGDDLLKYADYAIENLLEKMMASGADRASLKASLVGGAKIVENALDIGAENITAVKKKMEKERIMVIAEDLGGCNRRRVTIDLENGSVRCGQNDEAERDLIS